MRSVNLLKRLFPVLFLHLSGGSVYSMEEALDESHQEGPPHVSSPSRSNEESAPMIRAEKFERKMGRLSLNGGLFIPVEDLLFKIFPNSLLYNLKKAINHEKFLQCRLTQHYAGSLIPKLNEPLESRLKSVIDYLNVIKMIKEPGAAEGTMRNEPAPKGAELLKKSRYLVALFDEVGISSIFNEIGAPANPYAKYLSESEGYTGLLTNWGFEPMLILKN